jgi:hypothetical protein
LSRAGHPGRETYLVRLLFGLQTRDPEMTVIDTIQTIQTNQADDDFLLDDGLPCLRRDGKLYYLNDVQPRVLDACRYFEISFDQLSEKLGLTRPAMVLILKGYDPVQPQLKSMIDRLLGQVGLLPPQRGDCAPISAERATTNDVASTPIVTTIHAVPVPDPVAEEPVITVTAEEVGETMIPQPLTPGRPAASVPMVPPVFASGLPEFTPGLRRAPRRRSAPAGL